MAKEDNEQKSEGQPPEDGLKFNQEQYDFLKKCSEKGEEGIKEWNQWRQENPKEEIWLQGADLTNAHLKFADLREVHLENATLNKAQLEGAALLEAHLENVVLLDAHLEYATLCDAHLENAKLYYAHLENTDLRNAHLENATLRNAHLEKANLAGVLMENADIMNAHLENANLMHAHLEKANLREANLENANLWQAHLEGAQLVSANLASANFAEATVDPSTLIRDCVVDRNTSFHNVLNIDYITADLGMKEIFRYNVKRMNWEAWYRRRFYISLPVRLFFWISDYGMSTFRIMIAFLIIALSFAAVYYTLGAWDYYYIGIKEQPGVISHLFADEQSQVPEWLVPIRAIYFSIVTMTTLGFGDMYAATKSFLGHLLLTVQVILGYIILALIVFRLSELMRSEGPQAAHFAKTKLREFAKSEKDKTDGKRR